MILFEWNMLEYSRITMFILMPSLMTMRVYIYCVKLFSKLNLTHESMQIYNQFHYINQAGMGVVRHIAAALLGGGHFLVVALNFTLLRGWRFFPTEMMVALVIILICFYIIILLLLPVAASVHEVCLQTLCNWKVELANIRRERQFWGRILKAQRAVSLYYAMTKFEKETLPNFLENILDSTMTLACIL